RWYPAHARLPDGPRPLGSAWRSIAWCPVACGCARGFAASEPLTSAGQAEQKIHRALVGVGKLIAVELGGGNPAEISHPPRHRPVLLEPRGVHPQPARIPDISVPPLADFFADLALGVEPLFQLAAQRGAVVLPGFHATPGELPQHGKHGALAPLRDQVLA